jgi:hypothetical protein
VAIDRGKSDEVEVDVEEVLADLEHKVERVKILYEQFFMGIEKMEPQTARKEISRKLMELAQLQIRNTAQRYRFYAVNQKFGAYVTYWNRTMREIENGTYFRSVARAGRDAMRKGVDVPDEVLRALPKRLRARILRDRERIAERASKNAAQAAPAPVPASAPVRDDEPFDQTFDRLFDSLSGSTATPAAKPVTPAAPRFVLPPGMDEPKVRDLYRRYVAARHALGDDSEVKYEQILATVAKQGPKILEQHGAKAVEFGVAVKDGKVILKATPRK